MPDFNDKRLTPPAGKPGLAKQVIIETVPIYASPADGAEMVTQALFGETLRVFGECDGMVQVQLDRDRYVGWAAAGALGPVIAPPTHRIASLRTHAYCRANLKSSPVMALPMGSVLAVCEHEEKFLKVERAGWVPSQHVVALANKGVDPATFAAQFLNVPYLWGGCDSLGIDCTGLTRAAFLACGVILPRDSDMQLAWSGTPVPDWDRPGSLRRNDLVFWKGHVGIMLDADTLLHANAFHMAVAMEPLASAIERIAKIYGEPVGARRIDLERESCRPPDWLGAG